VKMKKAPPWVTI